MMKALKLLALFLTTSLNLTTLLAMQSTTSLQDDFKPNMLEKSRKLVMEALKTFGYITAVCNEGLFNQKEAECYQEVWNWAEAKRCYKEAIKNFNSDNLDVSAHKFFHLAQSYHALNRIVNGDETIEEERNYLKQAKANYLLAILIYQEDKKKSAYDFFNLAQSYYAVSQISTDDEAIEKNLYLEHAKTNYLVAIAIYHADQFKSPYDFFFLAKSYSALCKMGYEEEVGMNYLEKIKNCYQVAAERYQIIEEKSAETLLFLARCYKQLYLL